MRGAASLTSRELTVHADVSNARVAWGEAMSNTGGE
jgi:hypothetical protein